MPGDLKNQAKVLPGCQNHTLDFFFAGTDSRVVFATECFMIVVICNVFESPFGESLVPMVAKR